MDISLGALDRAISDERVKFDVMKEVAGVLSCDLERNSNLPEVSTGIFRMISDRTGVPDPFKAEKDECNRISCHSHSFLFSINILKWSLNLQASSYYLLLGIKQLKNLILKM